jgi:hypothetical protein
MRRHTALLLSLALTCLTLPGCDALGIETAPQVAAKKDAEAHAIGSACRHAVRSIEACFESHPKAVKAAMFNGWKEMDTYMRENEIVGMPSAGLDPSPRPNSDSSVREPADTDHARSGAAHKS